MTKLTNRLLALLAAWLGFDSAMDQKGKALAVVDMRTGDTTILHHRAVVGRGWFWLRSEIPIPRKRHMEPEVDEHEHDPDCPVHRNPMDALASMGVAGETELEQFERYIEYIIDKAGETAAPQAVVDHANASNRTLLDVVSVPLTDPEVMRALMFACFSVSMESFKAQQAGFAPPPYVISDGLAMSFVQTLRSIENGAMPDDIIDPEHEGPS